MTLLGYFRAIFHVLLMGSGRQAGVPTLPGVGHTTQGKSLGLPRPQIPHWTRVLSSSQGLFLRGPLASLC